MDVGIIGRCKIQYCCSSVCNIHQGTWVKTLSGSLWANTRWFCYLQLLGKQGEWHRPSDFFLWRFKLEKGGLPTLSVLWVAGWLWEEASGHWVLRGTCSLDRGILGWERFPELSFACPYLPSPGSFLFSMHLSVAPFWDAPSHPSHHTGSPVTQVWLFRDHVNPKAPNWEEPKFTLFSPWKCT